MRIAVIVATYNRPDALAALLEGYLNQADERFEIIIADDGSTGEVRGVIEAYVGRAPFSLTHLWHEDRGFRAAIARNRALAATVADYVIYTDGDCIPPRDFVNRHRQLAESGCFLAGNRVLLSAGFTERVLRGRLPVHAWDGGRWLAAPVFHLWHRDADRSGFAENQRLLDELLASERTRARLGVDQYL